MTDSEKIDLLLQEMLSMKTDISTMKVDISTMKAELMETRADVSSLKTDLAETRADVSSLKTDIKDLKYTVSSLEVHLENVTDKNIQTVAEGHLDLSRKLDNALKSENEKELLIIRVRMLEDEIRKVKERLDEIA